MVLGLLVSCETPKTLLKTVAFLVSQLQTRIPHMQINRKVAPAARVCGETRSLRLLVIFSKAFINMKYSFGKKKKCVW